MKRIFLMCLMVFGYSAIAQEAEKEGEEIFNNPKDWSSEDVYVEEEGDANAFFVDHTVTAGEQVMMVSRKYLVDPKDIYQYNSEAVNGISKGTILKIPLHKSHKKNLEGFIKDLEKKRGGPVQVAAPQKKKKIGVA